MSRNQRLIVVVGILISAIFLGLAFRGLALDAVWESIQAADKAPLLFAAAWYFLAVCIISLRWSYLLRAIKRIPWRELFPLVAIGYMGNNVYPLRSGEILRLVLLKQSHDVPITRGLVVSLAERMFDGLVMLTFLVVALSILEINSPLLRDIATITAPLFIIGLLTFFILASRPAILRHLVIVFSRFLPGKLREIALKLSEEILAGLEGFRSPVDLASAVFFSYVSWAVEASVYWIVSFAFNLNIDYPTALLMVGAVNLAGLIPASPGQVGVFEFFIVTALGLVGITETPAFAYAVTIHLVLWLPVTVIGFLFLAQRGLRLGDIARARALEAREIENKAAAL